jgi:hypothetical protein
MRKAVLRISVARAQLPWNDKARFDFRYRRSSDTDRIMIASPRCSQQEVFF